jgi:hypothetical protein
MTIDPTHLPPAIQTQLAATRQLSRGARTAAEWRAHNQRMAEIQANLAIEAMPLSEEERAFFDFAFDLNVPERAEDDLLQAWNRERLTARPVFAAE